MPKIKSYKSVGLQQAYDIEVDHPDHQFYLANGLLTSNSHAVSYAIDSYMCAWLLTHYEAEWLCAYVETQAGQPDKRSKAISELKSFGYEIVKVDINYATEEWTIMPDKKFMPSFLTVKGVGDIAIEEIKAHRQRLPGGKYSTIEQLLWNPDGTWRHSKFNKRALENLIKICAFDSMDIVGEGKTFRSYYHMWKCLIEDNAKLKHKKHGKAELERRIKDYWNECPEWSKNALIAQSKELVGNGDANLIISESARKWIEEKLKVRSIDDYEDKGLYWFITDELLPKKTKNNKDYMLITATGLGGKKYKIYCWGFNDQKHKFDINTPYIAELEQSQFGFATSVFKLRKAEEKKR